MRPKSYVSYYANIYPDIWKQVDASRARKGKDLPWWPQWCFLPLAGSYAIIDNALRTQFGQGLEGYPPMLNDVGIVGALAAWRVTQGIYRFDPDVYRDVIATQVTGNIPHDILFYLPEWCVYIETPGLIIAETPVAGFFAFLEYDVNNDRKELRIVLDLDIENQEVKAPPLVSLMLYLGPWSLKESLKKVVTEVKKMKRQVANLPDINISEDSIDAAQKQYQPLISLLLYLCAINSDIGDGTKKPTFPQPKKTKKGPRLFAPNQPTVWDVGVRMGAAIRAALAREKSEPKGGTHSSPRPHIRRAHWATYWTGSKKGQQKPILKWLSPILVGVTDKDLPVTIRNVY